MTDVTISNTSPLLYLHRIEALHWLPRLFEEVWIPDAVAQELAEGRRRGYDVPELQRYEWLTLTEPRIVSPQWLNLDLGAGELAVLTLALEHPACTVLLDDRQARRISRSGSSPTWIGWKEPACGCRPRSGAAYSHSPVKATRKKAIANE